jgi:3-methyladenine DNA glycosylase AlkD
VGVGTTWGMTCSEVMAELSQLGNESVRNYNAKRGVGENYFGVKTGDLRVIAKKIKSDPALAAELWATGNVDAMMLATLLMKPKLLSIDDLERMLGEITYYHVCDWFASVVKAHPQKEERREAWMDADPVYAARMGWSLATERVIKSPDGLDLSGLLDKIEREMADAPYEKRWTMNYCLAEIGINFPEHRERAVAIGEKIGAFRDYPVSKGCTSPFAPIWIAAMVERKV